MKHFSALYKMPVEALDAWIEKPAEERQETEASMKQEWDTWLTAHADSVQKTIALGPTKQVNVEGVSDTKNGLMLSSYVEVESIDEATKLFSDHPHLKLPGATIELMEVFPVE